MNLGPLVGDALILAFCSKHLKFCTIAHPCLGNPNGVGALGLLLNPQLGRQGRDYTQLIYLLSAFFKRTFTSVHSQASMEERMNYPSSLYANFPIVRT
jgi:hypothetical protein